MNITYAFYEKNASSPDFYGKIEQCATTPNDTFR